MARAATGQESPSCAPYQAFVELLPKRYGEQFVDASIYDKGPNRLEYWARNDRLSWSMLMVSPAGIACLVDAGGEPQEPEEPL